MHDNTWVNMSEPLPTGRPAVLCITGEHLSAHALAAAETPSNWRIITTNDAGESIALLYASRVQAVVLDQRGKRKPRLALARIFKTLRADVPVFLVSSQGMDPLPVCVDGCLRVDDGIRAIQQALHVILQSARVAA